MPFGRRSVEGHQTSPRHIWQYFSHQLRCGSWRFGVAKSGGESAGVVIPYLSTAKMFFVLTQACISILLFFAFAMDPQFVFALADSWSHKAPSPLPYQNATLTGRVENNDGKLRLILSNGSPQEFRGVCRISLGSDDNQKEVGQVELTLPAQDTLLLQITNILPSGDQYTLAIFDQNGSRRFLKIAPLRRVSDPTAAIAITLTPVQSQRSKAIGTLSIVGTSPPRSTENSNAEEFARAASQVQVQARLLADEEANDSFILSLEFRAQRPVNGATISITAGKLKDKKTVTINPQSHVEFKLPDQLETEHVGYTLTGKDGRVLAKGELDLQQLMADDFVTVNDIRTDRSSYDPGDTVRVTTLIEGKARNGYRLEVSARDGQSQIIFRDQKVIGAEDNTDSLEFMVSLPSNATAPVVFEFRIFNSETGLLFDSGEREIPMNDTKSPRRPTF